MAYFQRIALVLFLALPMFLPNLAKANQTPPVVFSSGGTTYGSMTEMCTAAAAGAAAISGKTSLGYDFCNYNAVYQGNTQRKVVANYKYQSGANVAVSGLFDAGWGNQGCPSGSTYVSGSVPDVVCTSPPNPCEAKTGQYGPTILNISKTSTLCHDGCLANKIEYGDYVPDCRWIAAEKRLNCSYAKYANSVYTGATCSPSDGTTPPSPPAAEPPPPVPEPDCSQCKCGESGGSWGQVNGIDTCVPQGSSGSAPVEITPPPTTTTTTPAPTSSNPNPTPTTTTTQPPVIVVTPSPSGSGEPNVTETSTSPDGSTVSKTQTKGQYCAENPNAQLCNGDGTGSKNSFNGNCKPDGTAEVVCDGDAIQCAIAKQSAEINCKFQPDQLSIDAFNVAKLEGDSHSPANVANRTVIDIPTALDDSTPFSATCPEDMFFTLAGHQIRLPISNWCPYLAWVGNVFLALAYLYGARALIGSL